MRRIGISVVCMLAAGLTLAVPSEAHRASFKSRVTIQVENNFNWHGRVKSRSPKCVANRLVKVFTESGKMLVSDKTDADGRWQTGLIGDRYYAKVTRDVRGAAGHRHACKGDRSPTKSAPPKPRAAAAERVRTRVTIRDDCGGFACRAAQRARRNYTATFFGRVKSREDRCERNRTVKLFRRNPLRARGGFGKIDSTRSESNGDWSIVRKDKPGFTDYYVTVQRVKRGNVVCKAARSATEQHEGP